MKKKTRREVRGQAALFDGVMFLLFATISTVMVYTSLSGYGVAQDEVLRSSYQIAYIESVGKALYYIDANTLYDVADPGNLEITFNDMDYCSKPGTNCGLQGAGQPYYDLANPIGGPYTCSSLSNFQFQTVADMLKRDLGDSPDSGKPIQDENNICLDNHFGINVECMGDITSLPVVPGKVALRCALKELMKPFHSAGFRYFSDIVKESGKPVPQLLPPQPGWQRATDSYVADNSNFTSCEDVQKNYDSIVLNQPNTQVDLLTTAIPFRVAYSDNVQNFFAMTLRICLWNSQL